MTNVTVMQRARTTIVLHPHVCIKTYHQPEWARTEIDYYLAVPWACPPLLWYDLDTGTVITKTLPLAANTAAPEFHPVGKLVALLRRLAAEGIHHRDVHPANIVISDGGDPLLLDWETAVRQPGLSYDLYGPDVSGVEIPFVHQECGPQWLFSDDPSSIKNQWSTDELSAAMDQRA